MTEHLQFKLSFKIHISNSKNVMVPTQYKNNINILTADSTFVSYAGDTAYYWRSGDLPFIKKQNMNIL